MRADGSDAVRLTEHPAQDVLCAWSLDGRRLAFESLRLGPRELFVTSLDGAEPRPLLPSKLR